MSQDDEEKKRFKERDEKVNDAQTFNEMLKLNNESLNICHGMENTMR